MLPETDFLKKRRMMFLLVAGRYYDAANSSFTRDNFIEFCGLRFPVSPGKTLEDEERVYLQKNKAAIEKRTKEIEKEILGGLGQAGLELELEKDSEFFLRTLCSPSHLTYTPRQYEVEFSRVGVQAGQLKGVFRRVLNDDYLVTNARLYPLLVSNEDVFVRLNGRNYDIKKSELTVEQAGAKIQELLEASIRELVLIESEKIGAVRREIEVIRTKNLLLARDLGVRVYPHCIEFGDMGFDKTARVVYHLIAPHYNSNTGGQYSEGQSAITFPFARGVISNDRRFAVRGDRNGYFSVLSDSCCCGSLGMNGDTPSDKMMFLQNYAQMIGSEGKFYEAPASSSDDGGSY